MRTYTQIVRVGEWLGPVDFDYDASQHDRTGNAEMNTEGMAMLRKMEDDPDDWRYSPCDFSSFEVVRVGMYDGWPFWKPTPTIGYIGPLNSVEVAFFYSVHPSNTFKRKGDS